VNDEGPVQTYLHVLTDIPREPRQISSTEIHERLAARGIELTPRSVQRIMENLTKWFDIKPNTRSKPYQYAWRATAPALEIPRLDVPTAFTFGLAETFLQQLMPASMLRLLTPYFGRAQAALKGNHGGRLARWTTKVCVAPRSFAVVPPQVLPQVYQAITEALLADRVVHARYRRRDKDPMEGDLHPLGLIVTDTVTYLVATWEEYKDIRLFGLHRFEKATMTETPRKVVPGFDLQKYARSGAIGFLKEEKPIRIRIRMEANAAKTFLESPLSKDQASTTDGDAVIITATVPHTLQLEGLLHSYASLLEVLEPASLRKEFATAARALARRYAD
jgi:predicted DNA-binding transcriptional regulator YafY